jgi:hypothetical protein
VAPRDPTYEAGGCSSVLDYAVVHPALGPLAERPQVLYHLPPFAAQTVRRPRRGRRGLRGPRPAVLPEASRGAALRALQGAPSLA